MTFGVVFFLLCLQLLIITSDSKSLNTMKPKQLICFKDVNFGEPRNVTAVKCRKDENSCISLTMHISIPYGTRTHDVTMKQRQCSNDVMGCDLPCVIGYSRNNESMQQLIGCEAECCHEDYCNTHPIKPNATELKSSANKLYFTVFLNTWLVLVVVYLWQCV